MANSEPTKFYHVVVDPDDYSGSTDKLVTHLSAIASGSADSYRRTAERGSITVAANLSRREANRISARLENRSVPASIHLESQTRRSPPRTASPDQHGHEKSSDSENASSEDKSLEWSRLFPEEDVLTDDNLSDRLNTPNFKPPSQTDPTYDEPSILKAGHLGQKLPDLEPYTDQHEHIPLLAGLLSALAPGAGQLYNGDSEKAARYTWRALFVRPWLDSIRHAYRRAKKVRQTGESPGPESLSNALYYLVKWDLIAVSVIAFLGGILWSAGPTQAPPTSGSSAETRHRAIPVAMERFDHAIQTAKSVAANSAEASPQPRYTLDERTRARRLFARGIDVCRSANYGFCIDIMQRVAKLSGRLSKPADRVRIWAKLREKSKTNKTELPIEPSKFIPEVFTDSKEEKDEHPTARNR